MRHCLQELSEQYSVAIISGRELEDVRKLISISTIYYAGNHGLEFAGPHHYEVKKEINSQFLDLIDSVCRELETELGHIEGILVENKKYSLSVHYRLVDPTHTHQIEKAVDDIITKHPTLAKHLGKKVFEIRPKIIWDKGKAVFYLLELLNLSLHNTMPIYIGDDVTDEDAFSALHEKGISILVSQDIRHTKADFYVHDTEQVMQFLKTFIK